MSWEGDEIESVMWSSVMTGGSLIHERDSVELFETGLKRARSESPLPEDVEKRRKTECVAMLVYIEVGVQVGICV